MRRLFAASCAALSLAFACHRWRSTRADLPPTRVELASRPVTIAEVGPIVEPALAESLRALRAAMAGALAARGFRVVEHRPYRGDLELSVSLERAPAAAAGTLRYFAIATLRSDDFFVDQAEEAHTADELRDPARLAPLAATLTEGLAVSDGLTFYIRASGTPAQQMITN